MGKRQTLINIIANMVVSLVNFCISFFLTPYLIRTVGKDAYGFIGLANNFVGYISILTIS